MKNQHGKLNLRNKKFKFNRSSPLVYITSAFPNGNNAHSHQIYSMKNSFSEILGKAFIFIQPQINNIFTKIIFYLKREL